MFKALRLQTLVAVCAMTLFALPVRSEMQIAEAPLLTVSKPAAGITASFTRADLEGMPQHTVRTTTTWTDGVQTFEGPLARDVLNAAQVAGETVRAIALNDYAVDIPAEDFERYSVILALRQNGEAMSVRDKGPIWIVYPRDDHSELQSTEQNAKWIWQLAGIDLR